MEMDFNLGRYKIKYKTNRGNDFAPFLLTLYS